MRPEGESGTELFASRRGRAALIGLGALAAFGIILVVMVTAGSAASNPLLPSPPPDVASLDKVTPRCSAARNKVTALNRQVASTRRLASKATTRTARQRAKARLGKLIVARARAQRARTSACRVIRIDPGAGVVLAPGSGVAPTPGTSSGPARVTAPGTTSTPAPPAPGTTTAPVTTPTPPGPPVPVIPAPGARALADRPDERSGALVHLVYVLPSDVSDRRLDTNGVIANSFAASQAFMRQAGGIQFRLDSYQGKPDISFLRTSRTNAAAAAAGANVRDLIEEDLVDAGFDQAGKILLVYYDGLNTTACGSGAWPPSFPGTVGALYMSGNIPGYVPCGDNPLAGPGAPAGYWEHSAAHEVLHLAGMVPSCAPNVAFTSHVGDSPSDLMYAGAQPWAPTTLDFGRNDYFKAGVPGCSDLADSPYIERAP